MLEKVICILKDFVEKDVDRITADSSLAADLGLSSLDVIHVVMAFEEEFGIEIPDEDIWGFATVGDVAEYLRKIDGAGYSIW